MRLGRFLEIELAKVENLAKPRHESGGSGIDLVELKISQGKGHGRIGKFMQIAISKRFIVFGIARDQHRLALYRGAGERLGIFQTIIGFGNHQPDAGILQNILSVQGESADMDQECRKIVRLGKGNQ